MAKAGPDIIFADAEFLASLPDLDPGSDEAAAVSDLAVAGRIVTVAEARGQAEKSYQAIVNHPLFQKIKSKSTTQARRAKARSLASSMPSIKLSRHAGMTELIVAAAALDESGAILTTVAQKTAFYGKFKPKISSTILTVADLTDL